MNAPRPYLISTVARAWVTCLLFCLLCPAGIAARASVKDSLIGRLPLMASDTNKVKLLLAIGRKYTGLGQPDSAGSYYREAEALSNRLHDTTLLVTTFRYRASLLNDQGRYRDALALNLRGIALARAAHNRILEAKSATNAGASYYYLEEFDSSLEYYLRSELIYEQENQQQPLAVVCHNIADVYLFLKQYDKAMVYGNKAVALSRSLKMDDNLVLSLVSNANILVRMKRYDASLESMHEALALSVKTADTLMQEKILLNIAYVAYQGGHYSLMPQNISTAQLLAERIQDKEGIARSLFFRSLYHLGNRQFAAAKPLIEQAIAMAKALNAREDLREGYLLLSDVCLGLGDLEAYKAARLAGDSIQQVVLSAQLLKNTQDAEARYKTAEKQHQIELQQATIRQNRLWNTILAASVCLILLVVILAIRAYRNKERLLRSEQQLQAQKILQLEQEQQLSATQSVLQGQEEERTRLAKDLHDGLGGMLSGIKFSFSSMKENLVMTPEHQLAFGRGMDMLDTSISELRRVAHNMMPESLIRFGLDAALQDQCNYINQAGIVSATYQSVGVKDVRIDQHISVHVYRIV